LEQLLHNLLRLDSHGTQLFDASLEVMVDAVHRLHFVVLVEVGRVRTLQGLHRRLQLYVAIWVNHQAYQGLATCTV